MKTLCTNIVFEKQVEEILQFLLNHDVRPYLVGGSVRDFLLMNEIGSDLDFEVHPISNDFENNWKIHLRKTFHQIANVFDVSVEELAYHVFRISLNGFELEFSMARIEEFKDGDFSHKNFLAKPVLDKNLKESLKRRDLSINAIVWDVKEEKFLDVYNGIEDLFSKKANILSDDFFRDPVRFLRLIRFTVNLDLKLEDEIKEKLGLFNLTKLSSHYFRYELFKCKDQTRFLEMFLDLQKDAPEKFIGLATVLLKYNISNLIYPHEAIVQLAKAKAVISKDTFEIFEFSMKKYNKLKTIFDSIELIKKRDVKSNGKKIMQFLRILQDSPFLIVLALPNIDASYDVRIPDKNDFHGLSDSKKAEKLLEYGTFDPFIST